MNKTKIEEFQHDESRFIVINNDLIKVTLCSLGASVYSIVFNGKEMLLTPKDLNDFVANNYYGKVIGRIGNRVKDGLVTIGDKTYQMPINEGNNTLHSGSEGLSLVQFDYLIDSNNYETKVTFHYLSREDKQSLPGDVYFTVTYIIKNNESNLYLTLAADSNKDTIIALTNHMYFSLGHPSLKTAELQIKASRFVHTKKADLIPLYEVPIVSCLDYRQMKPALFDIDNLYLQDHMSYGIDHHFVFDNVGIKNKNVIFQNNPYVLSIYTDFPGVQVYTCNYQDGIEKKTGLNDRYEGAAIEPQDSIAQRKIGKHFSNQIIYCFSKK